MSTLPAPTYRWTFEEYEGLDHRIAPLAFADLEIRVGDFLP